MKRLKNDQLRLVNNALFVFIIILVWCAVYYMCRLYPKFADDLTYSFIWGTNERITSISDIITSQYNHYMTWGGRSVVHFIDQVLIFWREGISDLLTSTAYVILVLLIYCIINKSKSNNIFLFLTIVLVLWFILPSFTETVFWTTGNANYVCGTCFILGFIYPYYRLVMDYDEIISRNSLMKSVLFFIIGIIVGWTNENMVIAMIVLLVLFVSYLKFNHKKIPNWVIWGILGACIGAAIMLFAPGNYARSSFVSHNLGLDEVSSFKVFKVKVYNLIIEGIKPFSISLFLYVLFLWQYIRQNQLKDLKKDRILFISLSFLSTAFLAYIVLFPIPIFPTRALFGINIFMLISIAVLYVNTPFKKSLDRFIRYSGFAILLIVFVFKFQPVYKELFLFSTITRGREAFIKEERSKGILDVEIPESFTYPSEREFLYQDPNHSYNKLYATYWDVNTIWLKKQPY